MTQKEIKIREQIANYLSLNYEPTYDEVMNELEEVNPHTLTDYINYFDEYDGDAYTEFANELYSGTENFEKHFVSVEKLIDVDIVAQIMPINCSVHDRAYDEIAKCAYQYYLQSGGQLTEDDYYGFIFPLTEQFENNEIDGIQGVCVENFKDNIEWRKYNSYAEEANTLEQQLTKDEAVKYAEKYRYGFFPSEKVVKFNGKIYGDFINEVIEINERYYGEATEKLHKAAVELINEIYD